MELKLATLGHISLDGAKPVLSGSRRIQAQKIQAQGDELQAFKGKRTATDQF